MEIYNNTYCIYVHINKVDRKTYVGQTIYGDNPNKRWKNGKGYKDNVYFYRSIQKYGWDNFEHEIIASHLTKEEANNFEELLITKLDTTNPDKGYNLKSGGGTNMCSQETRNRLSESHKGKQMSDEIKEKISYALKGIKRSDKTKRKIGEASKGRNVGRKHTEEELEKMRQKRKIDKDKNNIENSRKGVPISDDTKKKIQASSHKKSVLQKDVAGNIIKQYDSMSNASRETGISLANISSCCHNRVFTAGGFVWSFN